MVRRPWHRFGSIIEARRAFNAGENITASIKAAEGLADNPPYAIEIAYDLQSGSYSQAAESDPVRWSEYGSAIAEALCPHLQTGDTILDCGTGEMTSLVATLDALDSAGIEVEAAAFDLSWSRIQRGRRFVREHGNRTIASFVGAIESIALADSSVDVLLTVHALEPNGGQEVELLQSLLRVARRRLVLFEPCFERAGPAAKERMNAHGYIQGIEETIDKLGAKLLTLDEFRLPANPLNPTYVFVVEATNEQSSDTAGFNYCCPVTGTPLRETDGVFHAPEAGLVYPIIGGIPVLRADHALLATHFGRRDD